MSGGRVCSMRSSFCRTVDCSTRLLFDSNFGLRQPVFDPFWYHRVVWNLKSLIELHASSDFVDSERNQQNSIC